MTRGSTTGYTIGSATRRCAATGRELRTGEAFVAALAQAPDADDLMRLDFAGEAWDAGARPPRPLGLIGYWRGVLPEPGGKKRLLVDDQSLVELFEQTAEPIGGDPAADEDRLAFRFVLALILLRKRLLVQEGSAGPGGRNMLVRARGDKPIEGVPPVLAEVVDPGLDEAAVVRVTQQVKAVLFDDADAARSLASGAGAGSVQVPAESGA